MDYIFVLVLLSGGLLHYGQSEITSRSNQSHTRETSFQCDSIQKEFILQDSYYKNIIQLRTENAVPYSTFLLRFEDGLDREIINHRISELIGRKAETIFGSGVDHVFNEYQNYYRDSYPKLQQPFLKETLPILDCWNSTAAVITTPPLYSAEEEEENTENGYDAYKYATVVSGYWSISNNKYNQDGNNDVETLGNGDNRLQSQQKDPFSPYREWFSTTLKINMPYILFTDAVSYPPLLEPRRSLPTLYIYKNISSFACFQSYREDWVHPTHVPSKEIALLWLEKMRFLKIASQISTKPFLIWIDAGISRYRNRKEGLPPFSWSSEVLLSLPKDKLSYCHVSETYHSFSGGFLIVPRELVHLMDHLFYAEYEKAAGEEELLSSGNGWQCGSDQFLWTRIRSKYPELFHSVSYDYGDLDFLWGRKGQRFFATHS
jgi:hypothetical protein